MTYGRLFFLSLDCLRIEFLSLFSPSFLFDSRYHNFLILIFVFRLSHAINLLPLSATTRDIPSSPFLFFPIPDRCTQKKAKKAVRPLIALINFLLFSPIRSQPILSCLPTLHCVHVYHPTKKSQTYTLYTIVLYRHICAY